MRLQVDTHGMSSFGYYVTQFVASFPAIFSVHGKQAYAFWPLLPTQWIGDKETAHLTDC
jgi:hypothetical protein